MKIKIRAAVFCLILIFGNVANAKGSIVNIVRGSNNVLYNFIVDGSVSTVSIQELVQSIPPLNINTGTIINGDVLQVYYDGLYVPFDKDELAIVTPSGDAVSFNNSQLNGYSAQDNSYQRVLFGRYHQDRRDQPILWRILTVQAGQALLLSETILDVRPFDKSTNVWEKSSLKKWLNSDFLNEAFTSQERQAILPDKKIGDVFILGRGELSNPSYGFNPDKYSPDSNRSAAGSMTAYNNNLWRVQGSEFTNYFARTKANDKNLDLVAGNGKFVLAKVDRDNVGIRPAVWVDIASLNLSLGDGSIGYPFQ